MEYSHPRDEIRAILTTIGKPVLWLASLAESDPDRVVSRRGVFGYLAGEYDLVSGKASYLLALARHHADKEATSVA